MTTGDRLNSGKPPVSMVLEATHAINGCAKVLEFGADKYSRGNWKKGLKHTEVCDSLIRHLTAYLDGENNDAESKLPHVDHILCNALFLSELTRTRPDLDDRSEQVQVPPPLVPLTTGDYGSERCTLVPEPYCTHSKGIKIDDVIHCYYCDEKLNDSGELFSS